MAKSGKKLKKSQKWQNVTENGKVGKKCLWFYQIKFKIKPSARASRWLTGRSGNPAIMNNETSKIEDCLVNI